MTKEKEIFPEKTPLTEGNTIAEPKLADTKKPVEPPPATQSNLLSGDDLKDIKDVIKAQLLTEMQDDATRKREEAKFRRDAEQDEHTKYVEKMKTSPEPWVEIVGWVHTDQGVKIELDWNHPFVDYLKEAGIRGADDEQVVQKWVTLLLRDMADDMEERFDTKDSEFQ